MQSIEKQIVHAAEESMMEKLSTETKALGLVWVFKECSSTYIRWIFLTDKLWKLLHIHMLSEETMKESIPQV